MIPGKSTIELEQKYKVRRRIIRKGAIFRFGHEFEEIECLEIIRQLIVGMYFDYPIVVKASIGLSSPGYVLLLAAIINFHSYLLPLMASSLGKDWLTFLRVLQRGLPD